MEDESQMSDLFSNLSKAQHKLDCFVCDEPINREGIQLSQKHTLYSKTHLPTKISHLMGDGFVVLYTVEDKICQRCFMLLNRCDKLEAELMTVQSALTGFLSKKYNLLECATDNNVKGDNDADCRMEALHSVQLFDTVAEEAIDADVSNECAIDQKTNPPATESGIPKPLYNCSICSFATSYQQIFTAHTRKCKRLSYGCTMCERKFENPKQVRRHIMDAHLSKWPCHFCGESFSDQTEYTSHMKIHLSSTSYNPPQLQTELKIHANAQGNYECNICNFETENKADFHQHIRSHGGNNCDKIYKCKQCNIRCPNADSFKVHLESHETVFSPVSIEKGGNIDENQEISFNGSSGDLEVAVYLEDGSRCDENFNNDEDMEEEEDNFYQCPTCSLTFVDPMVLRLHEKTHQEVLNFGVKEECVVEEDQTSTDSSEDDNLEEMFERIHSNKVPGSNKLTETNNTGVSLFKSWNGSSEHTERILVEMSEETQATNADLLNHEEINNLGEDTAQISKAVNSETSTENLQRLSTKHNLADIMKMAQKKKMASVDVQNSWNLDFFVNDSQDMSQTSSSFVITNMEHLSEPTEIKTYICAICNYQSDDQVDLKKHFKEHRDNKSYACGICKRQLSSAQKLNSHLRSHQRSPGILTCGSCNEECADRFHLQQHMQEKHPKEKGLHTCQYCDTQFPTKKTLKTHEEKHPERFSIKCTLCDSMFLRQKHLTDHMELEHRDPHCRFCGKEILKAKALKNHELRHMREEESYDCTECDKKFKTKTGLRHHEAVHTGNYTYSCDFCSRGFMSRMMMEEHRSKHTKEERYICDVCGKKFHFQSTYWIHRKWHDNPYPYRCNFCNRMFRHSSLLAVHKRKHTGERPYQCPHCPLSFPVSGTLKRHLILHTGVYPFTCEDCNRGFTTKHKFIAHRVKAHDDFDLLNSKPPAGEYRMVIRDPPNDSGSQVGELLSWEIGGEVEGEQSFMFKMGNGEGDMEGDDCGEIILQESDELVPCTVITDSVLVDDMGNSRMVQIVLDESSQQIGTVAEENVSLLSDIWSYQ